MSKDTVKGIMEQVAAGTMDAAEAGQKMKGLKPQEPAKSYFESYHEGAIETDPNSGFWISAARHDGKITMEQYSAIVSALSGVSNLSEGDTQYYLAEGRPVRRVPGRALEVFTREGVWKASAGELHPASVVTPCSEGEALSAAKALVR